MGSAGGGGGVLATGMVGGPLVQTRPVPTIRSFLVPAPGPTMQWQGVGARKMGLNVCINSLITSPLKDKGSHKICLVVNTAKGKVV